MCIDCRNIYRIGNSKRPTKNELQKYIGKLSFVKMGEIYGVSDNAVRKWCKKYGLPTKRNEIKKYKENL